MTVRLRPHHLLCMLTYVGEGYTPAFVANYDVVVGRLNTAEEIVIVDGPDDICAPRLTEAGAHCGNDSVRQRDVEARETLSTVLSQPIGSGEHFVLDTEGLAAMRDAFRTGKTRKACIGCEWAPLCTFVADKAYAGTRLQLEQPNAYVLSRD